MIRDDKMNKQQYRELETKSRKVSRKLINQLNATYWIGNDEYIYIEYPDDMRDYEDRSGVLGFDWQEIQEKLEEVIQYPFHVLPKNEQ